MSQDHHHNQSASDRLLFPESPPPLQQASPSNDPLQNTVEGSNSNNNKRSRWVQRAVDTLLQNAETSNIDNVFLENYIALMDLYDSKCQAIERTVEETCVNLVTKAKVPGDAVDTGREDDGVEMRRLKGEFVNAMEVLQNNDGFHMRKGNLPKCATDVFKTWFHEHIDNPYPKDYQKKELAEITGVEVGQISNWFVNYRKRVWRPNKESMIPDRNLSSVNLAIGPADGAPNE